MGVIPGLQLLPRLPRVRTLRLKASHCWDEMMSLAATLFARITTLELRAYSVPGFDGLKQILLAMPQLTVLRLDGSYSVKPAELQGGHSLHLEKVDLLSKRPSDFTEWYVRGLSLGGVTDQQSFPRRLCIRAESLVLGNSHLRALSENSSYLYLYVGMWRTPGLFIRYSMGLINILLPTKCSSPPTS